jgi:hypothetical protein
MTKSITFLILRTELKKFLDGEARKDERDPESKEYLELLHMKLEETGRRFLWMVRRGKLELRSLLFLTSIP